MFDIQQILQQILAMQGGGQQTAGELGFNPGFSMPSSLNQKPALPALNTPGFNPNYQNQLSPKKQGGFDPSSLLNTFSGGSGGGMDMGNILGTGGAEGAGGMMSKLGGGMKGLFGAGGQGMGTAAGAGLYMAAGNLAGDMMTKNNTSRDGLIKNGAARGAGALKGAGTGAAIGSVIPGIGTAIGAGIGALAGGIFGKGNEDEILAQRSRTANNNLDKTFANTRVEGAQIAGNYNQFGYDMIGQYANGGVVGPGKGKKLSDLTTHARNKAMKKWAHKYGLENDPERIKGESDSQYANRVNLFKKKIRDNQDDSYLHEKWGKVSEAIQNIKDPGWKMLAEVATSPVEFPYQMTKAGMGRGMKSQKYKNQEYLDIADSGFDAALLGMNIAPQFKAIGGMAGPKALQQIAAKVPVEYASEKAFDKASDVNQKMAMGGIVPPQYQVEGGEVMTTPPGSAPMTDTAGKAKAIAPNTYKFEGDKHSAPSGGIGVQGGEGGFVFSDRLKADSSKYLKGL